ncbi:hypothetical protein HPB47_009710 [Ixodes persulcatus]|uniref:Uncharacterized protein n=1 Tax=Ixodes persulcatus TaxID=34615 RepID=A0AC60P1E6_IXOPE|nr:hypothetical protein HPB47_009710 [Ixodes persulcatus]
MVCCCVPLCKSEYKNKKDGGLSFHEFPVTHVRDQWIRAISRKGPDNALWQPNGRSKVCSLHFRDDDYKECNKFRRLLKPTAVPTIFPGYPWYEESLKKAQQRAAGKRSAGSADSEMEQDMKPDLSEGYPKPVKTYNKGPGRHKVLLLDVPRKPVATIASTRVVTAPSSQARRAEEAMKSSAAGSSSASSSWGPHTFFVLGGEGGSADSAADMAVRYELTTIAAPLESEEAILETVACETVVTSDDASTPIDEPHMLILPDTAPFLYKPAALSKSVGQQTAMTSLALAGIFSEIISLRTKCSDSKDQLGALSKENCDLKRKCEELQRSLEALAEENNKLKKRLCTETAGQEEGQAA